MTQKPKNSKNDKTFNHRDFCATRLAAFQDLLIEKGYLSRSEIDERDNRLLSEARTELKTPPPR